MLAEVAVGDLCTEAVEAAVEAVEKNVKMVVAVRCQFLKNGKQ